MDNCYTSVALFEELEENLSCCTVQKEKCAKELEGGESLYRQKGRLTCLTWRDRKPVSFLATIPTSETDSTVVQRSIKVNGQVGEEELCLSWCGLPLQHLYGYLTRGQLYMPG